VETLPDKVLFEEVM